MSMMLSRRKFGAMAAFGVAGALIGCSTGGPTVTVATIETDLQDILNGVSALVGSASITALLPAATVTQIQAYEKDAQGVLTEVKAAAGEVLAGTAQNWVTQVETDASAVVSVIVGVPGIPSGALATIEAINALLPVVLAAVGLTAGHMAATPSAMSPEQARGLLATPPKF